jgi:hypothetical protein
MSNSSLKVKTFGRPSDWGYRVVNAVGQTLVSRRGYPTESASRKAGHAAADALAPMTMTVRYSTDPHPSQTPVNPVNLWRSLFR